MATFAIQLRGVEQFDRLRKRMFHLSRDIHRLMDAALDVEARLLETTAQEAAPVDTGALRRSYRSKRINKGSGMVGVKASYNPGGFFRGANYAAIVHEKRRWSKKSWKGQAFNLAAGAVNMRVHAAQEELQSSGAMTKKDMAKFRALNKEKIRIGSYPNYHWFFKAAKQVGKGMMGRVVRRLRPALRAIYMSRRVVH